MAKRGRPRSPDVLTPREEEVLALIRGSLTNPQIAERLGITVETTKQHVSEILSKLGVSTREEAAAWVPGKPERRAWRRWAIAGLGTVTIVGTLLVLGLLAWGALESDADVSSSKPTGRIIFSTDDGLYTVHPDGSGLTPFVADDGSVLIGRNPVWSSDGQYATFTRLEEPFHLFGRQVTISEDGSVLTDRGGWFWSDNLSPCYGGEQVAWSPESEVFVYFTDAPNYGYQILLVNIQNDETVTLTENGSGPTWSPNGELIAYSARLEVPGGLQEDCRIVVRSPDPNSSERDLALGQAPAWSPDGESIAFIRVGDSFSDDSALYVADVDGGGETLMSSATRFAIPRWSPDGSRILVNSPDGLLVVNSGTGGELILGQAFDADWSPDGDWIVYWAIEMPSGERTESIYVARADGTGSPVRIASGREPDWTR